ncbi:MAG: hypothetical protein Q8K99_07830 [Actinomycetota bacterium]|nr:hypothetical protein [Actinomycetota bacterium]
MKRSLTLVVIVASIVATLLPAAAAKDVQPARRVVLVLAPYLEWSDITAESAPAIAELGASGALGNLNMRNRGRLSSLSSPVQGALTLSSGSWAAEDPLAAAAYGSDEYYEGGTAGDAFLRATGADSAGAQVVYLGMSRALRFNEQAETLAVKLGALGQAIVDAGGTTAAIGNSDSGYEVRGLARSRPAALVAMDAQGRVVLGDVSSGLLQSDSEAPFGISTDLAAFEKEYQRVSEELSKATGPVLVVLDPGDLQRAKEFAPEASPAVARAHHRQAVRTLDVIVDIVMNGLPDDSVIMVVPQALVETPGEVMGLAPVIVAGPGWSGYASSSSTQRTGLVTNLDVAATVTGSLGIEKPVEVLGNPMVPVRNSGSLADRVAELSSMNDAAVAVDSAKPAIINAFIACTTLILMLATVVLLRARRWSVRTVDRVSRSGITLLLIALTVPVASTAMFALGTRPQSAAAASVQFAVVGAILAVAALVLRRFVALRVPVAILSLLATGVILVDQWFDAPWSFTSFLGYSPLMGARYYGLGNESAAVLVGSVLVGTSLLMDQFPESAWTRHMRLWLLPGIGAVIVGTAAAPFLGANVGVVVWGVVAFGFAWSLMNRVRFGWRLALGVAAIVVALLVAFSLVDLSAGTGSQTHLARAWESARAGGVGELWLIVARKAETNMRVLTRTNWAYLLVAVLGFLGFMRWRPQGDFADTLAENPYFSAAMAACLVGGVAAYLTEDSGIVIPALMFLYVGVGILCLMLDRLPGVMQSEHSGEGDSS